ncbi:MAG: FIST N-terminal domain-containing protein [Candidatus Omnitrophota bacterium]|nr:FIST N-terminal domain-containing protein [Candidatus Omnitrophota bacterium]
MSPKVFASHCLSGKALSEAAETLVPEIKDKLGAKSCDVVMAFVSEGFHDENPAEIFCALQKALGASHLIGCNANGIVGSNHEIEMEPALSVLAMHLPAVHVMPMTFSSLELETATSGADLVKQLDLYPNEEPNFICLSDPMSCDVVKLLRLFNEGYPKRPVIGGLASAMVGGGKNWLFLNGDLYEEGSVGLAFSGDVRFDIVVSQGCRPIGETYTVTKSQHNILYELAGKPPIEVLSAIFSKLSPKDQELARHSLFVGLAIDENKRELKRGDYLIRNIMGADKSSGAISVGELIDIGQTLQFHLRDAETSREDLQFLLSTLPEGISGQDSGALLISCCGRGQGLYGKPDHDVELIQAARGPLPMTGFFANGEYGPVNQTNYVHGYTASLTIIR